jgi:hypothetical protein
LAALLVWATACPFLIGSGKPACIRIDSKAMWSISAGSRSSIFCDADTMTALLCFAHSIYRARSLKSRETKFSLGQAPMIATENRLRSATFVEAYSHQNRSKRLLGHRKSIQPMAKRLVLADYDQLHHFTPGSWMQRRWKQNCWFKRIGSSAAAMPCWSSMTPRYLGRARIR